MNAHRPALLLLALIAGLGALEHDAATTLPGGRVLAGERELTATLGGTAGALASDGRQLDLAYLGAVNNRAPVVRFARDRTTVRPGFLAALWVVASDADGDRIVHDLRGEPAAGRLFRFDFDTVFIAIYWADPDARGRENFVHRAHDGADRSPDRRLRVRIRGAAAALMLGQLDAPQGR